MIQNKIFYKQIVNFLVALLVFYLVFELNFYRHWSSISDQDLTLIHNSLLLNSNIKAEYHDHPGHTLIYLISIWLEILDSFSLVSFSSYNDISYSKNLEKDFVKVVIYSRFFNFFVSFAIIYSIYNILKLNGLNKLSTYLLIISFILSQTFLNAVGHIRTELLSAGCIFLSLLYFIKLIKKNYFKRKYIFLAGFFVLLSILCKWQSIFVLFFFPFIILVYKNKNIPIDVNKLEKWNIHNFLNIFYFIGIGLLCKKYMHGLNFIIIPASLFFIFFYILIYNKRYFRNRNFLNIFLFYFLTGISIGFFLLIIFKPFNENNIEMVFNFIGLGNMFISSENPYTYNINDILDLLKLSLNNIDNYLNKILFNRFNEIFLFLLFLYNFFSNFNKNNNKIFIIYFGILFVLIALFSTRPELNYIIYISPIMYIFLSIINIYKIKLFNLLLSLIIIFNIVNSFHFIKNHKFITEENIICSKENLKNKNFYWDRMRSDIFVNICQ